MRFRLNIFFPRLDMSVNFMLCILPCLSDRTCYNGSLPVFQKPVPSVWFPRPHTSWATAPHSLFHTFPIDHTNREILPMNSMEFPYMCNYTEFDKRIEKCVPWHWHPSFEFNYVLKGEVIVPAAENAILLKQGDAVFINSGIIHDVCAKDRAEHVRIYSHIFPRSFYRVWAEASLNRNTFPPLQAVGIYLFT